MAEIWRIAFLILDGYKDKAGTSAPVDSGKRCVGVIWRQRSSPFIFCCA